jgi:hypothetical protein
MTTSRGEGVLLPVGFETVSLPIAVTTLVVDGKRPNASFYKQITEADLVAEETGELLGLPLGYFHLHTKACPEVVHKHVLWGRERELHLSTVVALQQDKRYQRQKQRSLERQQRLSHLLALLLGLAGHSFTAEWIGEDKRELTIAGHTLYVNGTIEDRLQKLHMAREQREHDEEAWQSWQASGKSRELATLTFGEEYVTASERLLAQFDQQGIELKHPAQDKIEGKELEMHGFDGGESVEYGALSGPTTWCRYPASSERSTHEEPLLYWRAKDRQQRRQQEERLTPIVVTLFAPKHTELLLRLHFAESMVRTQVEFTRDEATYLVRVADIAALLQQSHETLSGEMEEPSSISPEDLELGRVWDCYERESKRYDAFELCWKSSLQQVQFVQQLFLVS